MSLSPTPINGLTGEIIRCAIEVHKQLGPGLLESVYLTCLLVELRAAGLSVTPRKAVPLVYKGIALESRLEIDLVVSETVIVEVKSVQAVAPVHTAQLLTYLKLTGCRVGLLINFNVPVLKDGISRRVNKHVPDPS